MIIYLSGSGNYNTIASKTDLLTPENAGKLNILMSFAYIKSEKLISSLIPYFQYFMLDSGAFTFLNSGKKLDWNDYVTKYCDFINAYNVKYFFELDNYRILGYEQTIAIRHEIEKRTKKRCIPVWHKYLGKDEYIKMCQQYDYIALGGIAIQEIKRTEHKYFPWFISTAHKYNTKIHGLGYTSLTGLYKYNFDSVDSSTWLQSSIRFGDVFKFTGAYMKKYRKPINTKIKVKKLVVHNFCEWVKFAEYAQYNLREF